MTLSKDRIFVDGNIIVVNPNVAINISGNGTYGDDELKIVYKDNHIFEITFNPKTMSVVLSTEQTPMKDRLHRCMVPVGWDYV